MRIRTIIPALLALALIAGAVLVGCQRAEKGTAMTPEKTPAAEVETSVTQEGTKNPVAVVEMGKGGVIEIEVYPKESPITAGNFIKLVEQKFYDGLIFHRVEPGFVAQTGDPTGTGTGGPGYTIKDEQTPFKHGKGAVGMAKGQEPNSAGSQWYICLEAAHGLDGGYTVFGKVIKGMDVVEKIQVGDKMKQVTLRKS